MSSYKLISAYIFITILVINVVPSSTVKGEVLTSIRVETSVGTAALTSIRVEPPIIDVGANNGEVIFGKKIRGERLIGHPIEIHEGPNIDGGVIQLQKVIQSPNREKITRVELRSWLGSKSAGERVHELCFSPYHDAITIKFWSQPNRGIHYTIRLFGL